MLSTGKYMDPFLPISIGQMELRLRGRDYTHPSVVGQASAPVSQCRLNDLSPFAIIPCPQLLVCIEVLLGYWMSSVDNFKVIFGFDEIVETGDIGTGWISHYQTRCKMYYLCSIRFHFLDGVLNIATRAPIAGGVSNKFDFSILVPTERTFSVPQCSEALAVSFPLR